VQAALDRVGITVVIDTADAASYFGQFIGSPSVNRARDFGLMTLAWGADWPTGYGFFAPLVDGRKILAQGNSNSAEIDDPLINTMIDQAAATLDPTAAGKIWANVDRRVMADADLVPMTWTKALDITSADVTNSYILASLGGYDIQALGRT
jgi:peptide/nickel transport system substrate-binding protein